MKETLEKLKIISYDEATFNDRMQAGTLLAESLIYLKDPQTVVLGIPRGGVVVAGEVARKLGAPLDVVLSRKLCAPQNPELAIGSITENGQVFIDRHSARRVGADEGYIQQEQLKQFTEIQRRRTMYRGICRKLDLRERTVIVVDDGVATGSTLQAALRNVAQEKPHRLIGAFPVAHHDLLPRLLQSADEIVCLKAPCILTGVGNFYRHFEAVSEQEVCHILKEQRERVKL